MPMVPHMQGRLQIWRRLFALIVSTRSETSQAETPSTPACCREKEVEPRNVRQFV